MQYSCMAQISENKTEEFIQIEKEWTSPNYTPIPVVLSRGEGVYVWDVNGKRYLDCLSAYSAVNQGHQHPKIVTAAKKQLEQLTLTSRAFFNDKLGNFMKELCEFSGYEMACPMNTGAEAVETAIKISVAYHKARGEGQRFRFVGRERAYHGMNIGATSVGVMVNNGKTFASV